MKKIIQNYQELLIWQKGMEIVKAVYKITHSFPKEEIYGITSQIRRSAVSIPSNIAEGRSRASGKEFIQFLKITLGSLAELETQLLIAKDIGYLREEEIRPLIGLLDEERKMLNSIIYKLKEKNKNYG